VDITGGQVARNTAHHGDARTAQLFEPHTLDFGRVTRQRCDRIFDEIVDRFIREGS
jgi:hypothetical protein